MAMMTVIVFLQMLCVQVCQKASDQAGCIQALDSDPRARTATDLTALANICLDLAVANTTDSLGFVQKMTRDPGTSPNLKSVLRGCVNNYQYAVNSFRVAISDLKSDVLTANYDIKTAVDGPQSCSDDLAKRGLSVPEISNRNSYVRLFSNIGDVITTAMLNTPSPRE